MKHGPNIAQIAAAIGDPARANMLSALMHGTALTATELALEAGVTKQTASSHLLRLTEAGLLAVEPQGRHRYFRIAGEDVAAALEALAGLAARSRQLRTRPGPAEPALRRARVCYDHLAGDLGVKLYEGLVRSRMLTVSDGAPSVSKRGATTLTEFGIDIDALRKGTRPVCRACLDWSVRRNHLAGALGAALLTKFHDLGWAKRARDSRAVIFFDRGEAALRKMFALAA
jgi:DNA-binding transcriptional ArsR family regulator